MDDERLSSFFSKGTYTKGKVSNLNLLLHAGPPRKFMNPEAPGQKRKMRPPASEPNRQFLWSRTLLWKFITGLPDEAPHLEEFGVVRPFGP